MSWVLGEVKKISNHDSYELRPPGSGASKSTCSTVLLFSTLSRNKLAKYLLATSLSCLTFTTSSFRFPSSSMLCCMLVWRVDAGTRKTRRTSAEMRAAFECV